MSLRPPPKISLRSDWMKELGSERAQRPEVGIPTLKRHMKERGDSLLQQTQKMCQIVAEHVVVMKAKDSTLEIKHFVKRTVRPVVTMAI